MSLYYISNVKMHFGRIYPKKIFVESNKGAGLNKTNLNVIKHFFGLELRKPEDT